MRNFVHRLTNNSTIYHKSKESHFKTTYITVTFVIPYTRIITFVNFNKPYTMYRDKERI